MSRSRSTTTFAWRALAVSAVLALPSSAAAAQEIVSRVGGPDSATFSARLVAASSDGQYAVLRPTAGEVATPTGYVIRDRGAQTTQPLDVPLEDQAGNPYTPDIDVRGISDDGDRVFFSSLDARFKALVGVGGTHAFVSGGAVWERSTGKLLRLPSYGGRPLLNYGAAKLSADGASLIYTTLLDPNGIGDSVIVRGPVDGAGVRVLDLPNANLWGASADLQTFAYERILPSVTPPDGSSDPGGLSLRTLGVKQGAAPPHRVAADKYEQFLPTEGVCTPARITWRFDYTYPGFPMVSADGSRIIWSTSHATSANPDNTSVDRKVILRTRTGERRVVFSGIGAPGAPGGSHDLLGPATAYSGTWDVTAAYADDDREFLHSEGGLVVADDVDLAGVPRTDGPLQWTADEPVDAATVGDATFRVCGDTPPPPPVLPVGSFADYATVAAPKLPRAGRSLGSVTFRAAPVGVRTAGKVTVEVRPLGAAKWTATRTSAGTITLPAARLLRPTTIRVEVQPAAAPGQPAPAPLVSTRVVLPLL